MRIAIARNIAVLLLAAVIGTSAAAQDSPPLYSGLVQDYDPAPAMWRLADEDTTIYMLGTVHLLPEGFRWRNPQLDQIVDQVDELVLESSDSDADASMAQIGPKLGRLVMERPPTSQQLHPSLRTKWERLVQMSGQNFAEVDAAPLMLTLMGFGMSGTELGLSSYEHGVEDVLAREFIDSGRPVSSIEDTGRVMMNLYRMDDNLILPELERDLYLWDGFTREAFFGAAEDPNAEASWELEHSWARGELQDEVTFGMEESKLAIAFNRVLLTDRNRRWAVWLEQRLNTPGTILLAVGGAHFEGRGSVLQMLRERGLEAVRIN